MTPDRSVQEVTAAISTISCISLLIILALISPQLFQREWNIGKQIFHLTKKGGIRNIDL